MENGAALFFISFLPRACSENHFGFDNNRVEATDQADMHTSDFGPWRAHPKAPIGGKNRYAHHRGTDTKNDTEEAEK